MVDAIVRRMAVDQPDFSIHASAVDGRRFSRIFAKIRERSRKASQGLAATGFCGAKAEIRELSAFCNRVPKAVSERRGTPLRSERVFPFFASLFNGKAGAHTRSISAIAAAGLRTLAPEMK
jgi:hypothetical protein